MKKYLFIGSAVLLLTISGGAALAGNIASASFYGIAQATNNSTVQSSVSVPFAANTTSWINAGILNATATNIVAHRDTGTDTAIMPGYGSNPWVLFYDSVAGYSNRNVTLYTGAVSGGKLVYFPSASGMTVADNASTELGGNFTISLTGIFLPDVSGNVVYKSSAINCYCGSGNITAKFYGTGPTLFATLTTAVTTGEHNLLISAASDNVQIRIDGILKTSVGMGGYSVADYNPNWTFGSLATPYIISTNITVGGTLRGSWIWQYAATFTDLSGNGNTATPSFRTTSSASSVNATLASFLPVNQAVSDISANSSWGQMVTAVPTQPSTMYTENATPGIFFAGIVHAIWPESGVPESFFWYSFAFAIIILAGLGVYYFFAGKGQSALLIKVIVMMAIIIFWALPGPNIYGMYVAIYFGMFAFGVLVLKRSYGW